MQSEKYYLKLFEYIDHNSSFMFDLQRFASADAEGRTESATEHKRKKSRDEGRVALSKDLPAAIITLLTFSTIVIFSGYIFNILTEVFRYVFENMTRLDVSDSTVYNDIILKPLIKSFIPIASVAFISAALSNYMQIGFKFTPKAIKPDFKKIVPDVFKYLKKQVFSISGYFSLLKSIVKIIIIALVSFFSVKAQLDELLAIAQYESIITSFQFIISLIIEVVFKTTILLIIFSLTDVLFVRWQFEDQQKMKKQEIKEEHKEMEGDPQVKMKLKQMYKSLMSQQKMLAEVSKSDVVITNPTHYAVALRYDSKIDAAPRVIAKGKDKLALEIKEIAKENNIFMYENVPLARKLYAEVEINDLVPEELFGFIVVAYKLSYQSRNKKGVLL
ncbi:MAG TPA: flagellar biosynthesis protein FlhB [Spirochaetia bacterium]|nr:flagellar biosynthesis protein FlhB [Spirochaetia bacterium]HBI36564.1 flagellar biosynthesis protein FlhB [Spirochaetia bacterium]